MRRKLLVLNLVLAVLTGLAVWRLRKEWTRARQHEKTVLNQPIKPSPAPPVSPLAEATPVLPSQYIDIAQKMLFTKDRNPNVVVEPPPPPPVKPMPPLPMLHGVMNLGDGPTAILSAKNGPHGGFKAGEQFGEFTLIGVNNQEITLQWEGQTVVKKLDEMQRPAPEVSAPNLTERTAPVAAPAAQVKAGPGVEISGAAGVRACVANDSTPAGTVVDGLRKVVTDSPFGPVCRWEPAK